MKKIRMFVAALLALIIMITPSVIPVSAAMQGYEVGHFTYINPLYEDFAVRPKLYSSAGHLLAPSGYNTLTAAGAVLRDAMEQRASTVAVGYVADGTSHTTDQIKTYAMNIFNEATRHTGVPTEGDYLMWHYSSYSCDYMQFTESGKTYITYNYKLDYLSTAQQEQQMDSAVNSLVRNLDVTNATDYEKVCAVYDYICENISYDTIGLNRGDELVYTAYAALINNKAVCQGYASLFYRLSLTLNVDARLIAGYGAGGRHGWNIVELSGKYYNLDSTWDAALCQENLPYEYFLRSEANFGDHERLEEYSNTSFHSEYPMSASDYDAEANNGGEAPPPANENGGQCGNAVTWQLGSNGALKISGSGEILSAPWKDQVVRSVEIGYGVTSICNRAFENCTDLTSVSMPQSIAKIGERAFAGCAQLTSLSFPSALKWIYASAFEGCIALRQVQFAAGVTSIGDYAFLGCKGLTYIQLPNNTQTIGKGAFFGCSLLQTVEFADTIQAIYEAAFANCVMLDSITLPKDLNIIYNETFKNCTRLESITVPSGVTVIGANAFDGCGSLIDVHYKGSKAQWGNIWIGDGNVSLKTATLHCAQSSYWSFTDNKWYYYENGNTVKNRWMRDSKGWVYLGDDGAMVTNAWCTDSQGWCYVGADGYAVTNCWKKDSYGWIWLNSNGSMTKNSWVKDGGKWYFLNNNGYMVSNCWKKDSIGWVYLGADGAMKTNAWVQDSKGWCYVGADGYAVTNCWKKDSHGWIYLNGNGSMTKSAWVQDGSKWYYLDANGYMVANKTLIISGKKYTFNALGVWVA